MSKNEDGQWMQYELTKIHVIIVVVEKHFLTIEKIHPVLKVLTSKIKNLCMPNMGTH